MAVSSRHKNIFVVGLEPFNLRLLQAVRHAVSADVRHQKDLAHSQLPPFLVDPVLRNEKIRVDPVGDELDTFSRNSVRQNSFLD